MFIPEGIALLAMYEEEIRPQFRRPRRRRTIWQWLMQRLAGK